MKRFVCFFVLFMMIAVSSYGATVSSNVSSSTVTFSNVGRIVTFNSAINHALIINESSINSVHVSFDGLGWQDGGTTYLLPAIQTESTVGAVRLSPGASFSVDVSTTKIGFITNAGGTENVQYVVTSDRSI